ncbi:MAG: hypothetical protein FGM15_06115 [Chthoniobacterales bacterium]|nr:hypothetical protein [Chthoniobacterales bacterium]
MKTYIDNRPTARLRMNATDAGRIFRHGEGPGRCDAGGAREASVVHDSGTYYLFYDGAEPGVGWRACLATSTDLKNWRRHGPILELGEPGRPDSHTAASPWFFRHGDRWHAYYVGCQKTTPAPDCIPHVPYLSCKAEAADLSGPWTKRYDVEIVHPVEGTYYGETASPGFVFEHDGKICQFFSAASGTVTEGRCDIHRTLGLLQADHPDGPWAVSPEPLLPVTEQIENSSLYFEPRNGFWFLFTNHVGIDHRAEFTDAIWVYWSRDPRRWDASQKAVVLDGQNCSWSHACIGMPSVVPIEGRLALFYDAPGSDSISHMGRDIGLAWLELPLQPPNP